MRRNEVLRGSGCDALVKVGRSKFRNRAAEVLDFQSINVHIESANPLAEPPLDLGDGGGEFLGLKGKVDASLKRLLLGTWGVMVVKVEVQNYLGNAFHVELDGVLLPSRKTRLQSVLIIGCLIAL